VKAMRFESDGDTPHAHEVAEPAAKLPGEKDRLRSQSTSRSASGLERYEHNCARLGAQTKAILPSGGNKTNQIIIPGRR